MALLPSLHHFTFTTPATYVKSESGQHDHATRPCASAQGIASTRCTKVKVEAAAVRGNKCAIVSAIVVMASKALKVPAKLQIEKIDVIVAC